MNTRDKLKLIFKTCAAVVCMCLGSPGPLWGEPFPAAARSGDIASVVAIGKFRGTSLYCGITTTGPNRLLSGRKQRKAAFKTTRSRIEAELKGLVIRRRAEAQAKRRAALKRAYSKLALTRRNLSRCQARRPPYEPAGPATAPQAPSGLVATVLSSTAIQLTWLDNSTTETGFKLERSSAADFAEFTLASLPAHDTGGLATFSDTELSPETTYYYRVKATNAAGDSEASAVVSATTAAQPAGDAPSAESKTIRAYVNVPQAISIHVSDPEQNTLTVTIPPQTLLGRRLSLVSKNTVSGEGFVYVNYAGGAAAGTDQFSYKVSDGQNEVSGVITIEIAALSSGLWLPPLGIPRPEFGIDESHLMYNDKLYEYDDWVYEPGKLTNVKTKAPYKNGGSGPYTHYVDASHPNAVDSEYHIELPGSGPFGQYAPNVFGSPEKPRKTVPKNLPPGSVVEVHSVQQNGFGEMNATGVGTRESPIFIRGIGSPRFEGTLDVGFYGNAAYLIVERLSFFKGSALGRQDGTKFSNSHLAVRNCEFRGNESGGGTAVVSWTSNPVSHVVFYNNIIHENGVWDPAVATGDQDNHGVGVANTSQVWIVDNQMYHNSGDGIQINGTTETTHHIYVGRNHSHHNKQSGFWTKTAADVIFSENIADGHRPSSSSSGPGLGFQYDPKRVWFLFNRSFDNEHGIACGSGNVGGRDEFYFIGNTLYQNKNGFNLNGLYPANQPAKLIGNTIYGSERGIYNGYYRCKFEIVNNIIAASTYQVYFEPGYGTAAASTMNNNLLEGQVHIFWEQNFPSLAQFQTAAGQCTNCIEGDPKFVNPLSGDFHLNADSPAKGAAVAASAYDRFEELYGIDIRKDADGIPRPQGNGWDFGAYEHVE